MFSREEIVETLKNGICTVTFTKVNGELREMPCTLKEGIVPVYERKTPVNESADKETNTLSVWCTDKNAWRSFHVNSVKYITINEENKNS